MLLCQTDGLPDCKRNQHFFRQTNAVRERRKAGGDQRQHAGFSRPFHLKVDDPLKDGMNHAFATRREERGQAGQTFRAHSRYRCTRPEALPPIRESTSFSET